MGSVKKKPSMPTPQELMNLRFEAMKKQVVVGYSLLQSHLIYLTSF